ncbi:MAG TPA: PHB depolymerase family esterase [Micromonosporaceae bacterium]
MRRLAMIGLALAVGLSAGCRERAPATPADPQPYEITVDGRARTFLVHVPAGQARNAGSMPIVLALHGNLGTGDGMRTLTHFDRVADANGLIVAYPDGYRRSWADGRGATAADQAGVDDVAFLAAVLDTIRRDHPVADRTRAFATGMSNGAMMAHRLGCDLADRVVAIAPVAGGMPVAVSAGCRPVRPVAVLDIQGTADPLVPYQGGEVTVPGTGGQRGELLSATRTATRWARLNGCAGVATTGSVPDRAEDGTRTTSQSWCGGRVQLYTVDGGGHAWPGGLPYLPARIIGPTAEDFDASELIAAFFAAQAAG